MPEMIMACVLFCIIGIAVIAQEQITLTTYYPSPYGVYNKVRLYPHAEGAACTPGELYYNASGVLYLCDNTSTWVQALTAGGANNIDLGSGDIIFGGTLRSTRTDGGWVEQFGNSTKDGLKWNNFYKDLEWYYNDTVAGFFDFQVQGEFANYSSNFNSAGGLFLRRTDDIIGVANSSNFYANDSYQEQDLCIALNGKTTGNTNVDGWVKQCEPSFKPWTYNATSADVYATNPAWQVGVGNIDPGYPLDISGRSRVRGTAAGGGGFWLTNPAGTVTSFMGRGTAAEPFTGIYSGAWNFMVYDAGDVGITNSMTWNNGKSSLNADQGGSIELGNGITAGAVPYIDFHYGTGAAQDYNMRIINEANGALAVYGGTLKVGNLAGVGSRNVVADASGILSAPVSSRRYKKDIVDLTADPGNALKLRPVRFKWKKDDSADIGLIAEDVDQIIKDLVIYNADGKPEGVKYEKVPLYLLITIRDQQKQIEALKKQNDDILKRLESLERKQNR